MLMRVLIFGKTREGINDALPTPCSQTVLSDGQCSSGIDTIAGNSPLALYVCTTSAFSGWQHSVILLFTPHPTGIFSRFALV